MKVVVIGASFAGLNVVRNLPGDFEKVIICLDKYPYKKNFLLDFLLGRVKSKDLLFEEELFNIENTEYFFAKKVTKINPKRKSVILDDKTQIVYDVLVIAVGSRPRYISCPGVHKRGVVSLSVLEDIKYIKDIIDITSHIVLYLNTSLGYYTLDMFSLRKENLKVLIPEELRWQKIKESVREENMDSRLSEFTYYFGLEVKEVIGNGDVKALRLSNGKIVACDLFIVDTGIKPNLEVVKNTDILCEDALIIDGNFSTNIEDIFAVGDVVNQDLSNYIDYKGTSDKIIEDSRHLAQIIKSRY